jgi:hypothetical protein
LRSEQCVGPRADALAKDEKMSEAPEAGGTTPATRAAEDQDAGVAHTADRGPTPAEERAAEGNTLDPDVAEHYKDAARTGAHVHGEGAIE